MNGDPVPARGAEPSRLDVIRRTTWRLVVSTVGTCFRHRVTGLAAEAAFFALLSLPPLIFGLAGSIGYVFSGFSRSQIVEIQHSILDLASKALTDQTVDSVIRPTLDDVFRNGRFTVISVGFVLALWSGSRALNVFVDTITIMYGLGGQRGIVRTRALSFGLYVLGLITGVVAIPLVVAGPRLVDQVIPHRLAFLSALYWPVVLVLSICFLATLYHVSVPVRTSWRYNLPGSVLTLAFWILGSYLLRLVLNNTAHGSTSIYGPLAAPIVVMLWLYLLSIAVLIGAALNSSFDRVWPEKQTARARMELVRKLRLKAILPRLRRDEEEQERFPDQSGETVELAVYDEQINELEAEVDETPPDSPKPAPSRRGSTR